MRNSFPVPEIHLGRSIDTTLTALSLLQRPDGSLHRLRFGVVDRPLVQLANLRTQLNSESIPDRGSPQTGLNRLLFVPLGFRAS
jgi:hypothetical protein